MNPTDPDDMDDDENAIDPDENAIDPEDLDDDEREQAHETALQVVREIVESAECDRNTGEVILWGRWGTDQGIEEERFQSLEDIKDFLLSFGWMTGKYTSGTRDITLVPFSEYPIVNDYDVTDIIARMIRQHGLGDLLGDAHDFVPSQKLFDFREVSSAGLVSARK